MTIRLRTARIAESGGRRGAPINVQPSPWSSSSCRHVHSRTAPAARSSSAGSTTISRMPGSGADRASAAAQWAPRRTRRPRVRRAGRSRRARCGVREARGVAEQMSTAADAGQRADGRRVGHGQHPRAEIGQRPVASQALFARLQTDRQVPPDEHGEHHGRSRAEDQAGGRGDGVAGNEVPQRQRDGDRGEVQHAANQRPPRRAVQRAEPHSGEHERKHHGRTRAGEREAGDRDGEQTIAPHRETAGEIGAGPGRPSTRSRSRHRAQGPCRSRRAAAPGAKRGPRPRRGRRRAIGRRRRYPPAGPADLVKRVASAEFTRLGPTPERPLIR